MLAFVCFREYHNTRMLIVQDREMKIKSVGQIMLPLCEPLVAIVLWLRI